VADDIRLHFRTAAMSPFPPYATFASTQPI
jgi:hypothetical protein